jgi:hypothetical protein
VRRHPAGRPTDDRAAAVSDIARPPACAACRESAAVLDETEAHRRRNPMNEQTTDTHPLSNLAYAGSR